MPRAAPARRRFTHRLRANTPAKCRITPPRMAEAAATEDDVPVVAAEAVEASVGPVSADVREAVAAAAAGDIKEVARLRKRVR